MELLKQLESKMEKVFKDMPQLPKSSKDALAKFLPWLALVSGILQLFAASGLWTLARWTQSVTDLSNSLSRLYTGYGVGPSSFDKTVIYFGIAILVVDAVILLMAFPKLQKKLRAGWDLLFLGSVLNLVFAVVQIFTYQRGLGSFIMSLIGSAIGFYLLFQVKENFPVKK